MPNQNSLSLELHMAKQAGELHRAVLKKIMPWIKADPARRPELVHEALMELRSQERINAEEFETLRKLTEDISKESASKEQISKEINIYRSGSKGKNESPVYIALMEIAADSVETSPVVPIAAADLAGGIFGGAVAGGWGALAGAVALSAFTAS